ncbi:MaoC family dehydratase [Hoeflea sp. WL0058]|uniref:MaoC family dehydratase n=1 Tax=Flavimaribacter sediminis TaxID=2865987 RepID=A0AAE2ZL26_9HYPH|nr:MaoC family dehydratase [Flavimaribacter sediminis]MBW8638171.1 MaoC family dehydratase [Flavimaribacter sediminis]
MAQTRLFEDFEVGETWTSRKETITEEDIIAFAKVNDPQPIHTDPATAAKGRFGTVIASGWQIAALSLRLFIEDGGYGDTPMVGLGVDELRWRQVVKPGDVLEVKREVIETRRSKSRPDRGVIRTRVEVSNQNGEVVLSLISSGQVPTRTSG